MEYPPERGEPRRNLEQEGKKRFLPDELKEGCEYLLCVINTDDPLGELLEIPVLVTGPRGKFDGFETIPVSLATTQGPRGIDLPFDLEGFIVDPDQPSPPPRVGFVKKIEDNWDEKFSEVVTGRTETAPLPDVDKLPLGIPVLL